MHELGVAHDILKVVLDNVGRHGGGAVTEVRVRVGELALVVPDCLTFAFEAISIGTLAEGAKLKIVEAPLRATCRACGHTTQTLTAACAECGGRDLDRQGGHEVIVASMELDDAVAENADG